MAEIVLLADRPALTAAVTDTLMRVWPEWYGPLGEAATRAEADSRVSRDALPVGLAALDGERIVGLVALNDSSIATHRHLTPWLGGLWVDEAERRRGLGQRLVAACRAEARRLGFEQLHAATASAGGLFERDGWTRIDTVELDDHPGELVTVYRCRP